MTLNIKTKGYYSLVALSAILGISLAQTSIDPTVTSCATTQYYDSTLYECQSCPENSFQDDTGFVCECNYGFIVDNTTRFDFHKTCIACVNETAPSEDKSECLPCESPAFYSPLTGACVCPEGFQTIDRDHNGTKLTSIACQECPANQYRGPATTSIWECEACPHFAMVYNKNLKPWECVCPTPEWITAGDTCIKSTDIDELTAGFPLDFARQITYHSVVDIDGLLTEKTLTYSDLFNHYYYYAAIGCWKEQDPTKCQILANLCALQLYDETSSACSFFKYLTEESDRSQVNTYYNDEGWVEDMPWLYYYQTPSEVIQQGGKVDLTVSFVEDENQPERTAYLTFYLARYNINGTFLGFQKLKSELSLCSMTHQDVLNMLKFGAVTENICEFSLHQLLQWDPENLPEEANSFFDLFIQDKNGNLIDVPVLIRNFRDKRSQLPNTGEFNDSWRFVRRFFIYDTISGIDQVNGFANNTVPSIVRWPSEVKVKITLDPNDKEKIYVPYLEITYQEKATSLIHENTKTPVKFVMDYYQDMSKFWKSSLIAFIIFQAFIAIIVIIRMVFFWQRNPPSMLGPKFAKTFIMKLSFHIMDVWSGIMFWITFFMAMYWFIVYKMQANAYVLLPSVDDWSTSYKIFDVIFGLILGFRFIVVVMKIIEQSTVDIFLIDWERPKMHQNNQNQMNESSGDSVTIWRSIFLANEYNELQSELRYLRPETTLIWFGFFIRGLGWEYLALADPDMTKVDNELQPLNYILMFFMSALIFLVIGAIQYILEQINSALFSIKYQEFMDLCAVSNISLLIMDSDFHGYYVHGEAPWVHSDLVLSQLKKNLDEEGEGKQQKRGLTDADAGFQCYEIYFPADVRKDYDEIYRSKISLNKLRSQLMRQHQQEVKKHEDDQKKDLNQTEDDVVGGEKQTLMKKVMQKKVDLSIANEKEKQIAEMELKKRELSNKLKLHINTIKLNPHKFIYTKTHCERLMNQVPTGINLTQLKQTPVLVKDTFTKWPSFTNVLYCKLDYDNLILYIMFFALFQRITGNSVISIAIVYTIEKILRYIRQSLGESNLSKKTLIDEKFLI